MSTSPRVDGCGFCTFPHEDADKRSRADVVLTVLFFGVMWLVPLSYEGAFPIIQQLLWVASTAVLVIGLLLLSRAVDEPLPILLTVGAALIGATVDLMFTFFKQELALDVAVRLYDEVTVVVSLLMRGLLIFCLARLTMKTHAWVLSLLATVALLRLAAFGSSTGVGGRRFSGGRDSAGRRSGSDGGVAGRGIRRRALPGGYWRHHRGPGADRSGLRSARPLGLTIKGTGCLSPFLSWVFNAPT